MLTEIDLMDSDDKRFAVLTCDVIRSSTFNVHTLSNVLSRSIDEINHRFAMVLYRPLCVMFGDSIQCVVSDWEHCFDVFQIFEEKLWLSGKTYFDRPILIRCGIGIGSISNPTDVLGKMTGQAFILARKALDSIIRERKKSLAYIEFPDEEITAILSAIMSLVCTLKSSWTYTQRQTIDVYRNSTTQEEAAEILGLSRPAITKNLENSSFQSVKRFESVFARLSRKLIQP